MMKLGWNRLRAALAAAVLCGTMLAGCQTAQPKEGLSIVATVYASYDFAKQLTETFSTPCSVKLLLTPGGESHSYEPSPSDVAAIQTCDVFLYIGGESEVWADKLLESSGTDSKRIAVRLMDSVTPLEEETVEGMEHHAEDEQDEHESNDEHDHDHDAPEYDEHIWTSPKNAIAMTHSIAEALRTAAPVEIATLRTAEEALTGKLQDLDTAYQAAADAATNRTLMFADRFPFRYLTEAYGWTYYAAFAGCSSDTDASSATLAFLISQVQTMHMDTVFYLENSSRKIADAVCKATGAKALELQSCNNVSKADFDAGKHYQEFMMDNLTAIKEALNDNGTADL